MPKAFKCRVILAATVVGLVGSPAVALGLGDLAKVVLKGNSTLKKAQDKCGSSFALTSTEQLIMNQARDAVFRSIPAAQFTKLDSDAEASADTAAQSSTYCPETQKKKKGLLGGIKKAGKAILSGGKLLGL